MVESLHIFQTRLVWIGLYVSIVCDNLTFFLKNERPLNINTMLCILHRTSWQIRPYITNKPMVRRMHTHELSSRLEDLYYGFLIISPIVGGGIGLVGGTYKGLKDMKHKSKYDAMLTPLAYGITGTLVGTFIGAAFGFTAPVSIPLLGLGVILNIDKT